VPIVCCISILSWFIAAQGQQNDPDYNDYLTSKWLVLIRPLVAGFDTPLTTQQRFVSLRAEGWSFARIADEIKVSKPTLINWSRKFQFDIQNLRAINIESLNEKWLLTREARVSALGEQLKKLEAELAKRDVTSLTTHQLFTLADALRRQIKGETGPIQFSTPVAEIPSEEFHEQIQDWNP
jgi:hypothetical protein